MAQGSILHVDAGQDIPELLLEKLLKAYPTTTGAAFIVDGSDEVVMQQGAPKDITEIKEMREAFKDYPMFMCFHKFDGEFHEDDTQPYVVLADNEDKPILVAMLEGNFSKHALEGSSRTPAYFALINFIQPRIEQFNRLAKGDIELVLEEMMKDNVKQEVADLVIDRGSVVLIPAKGVAIHFGINNDKNFVGEWGWVTDACGYTEGEFPPPKEEEPVTMTAQERLKALVKKKVAVKKKIELETTPKITQQDDSKRITQVGDTKVIHPPEVTQTVLSSTGPFLAAPPKGLSHNQTKKWYEANAGYRPKDWHARPEVNILPSRINAVKKELGFLADQKGTVLKTLSAMGQALGIKKTEDATEKTKANVTDITVDTFVKNVTPEHIKSSPVLPPRSLEVFQKEFMSNPMIQRWMKESPPSLEALESIEKKLPNFYEQTGLQLENLMTPEQIADIVYKHQDVAILLLRTVLVERAQWRANKALEQKFTAATTAEATAPKRIAVRKKGT